MTNFLQPIGATVLAMFEVTGRIVIFAASAIALAFRPPFYFRMIGRQLVDVGYYSLPVVGLTAIFTGMVLVLQSYTGFTRFSAESAIPNVVVISLTRELGPVLAGLMVAGRVGAAMAAEIGTMRVTEQIDALSTLSTNPLKYLVVPRLIAGLRPGRGRGHDQCGGVRLDPDSGIQLLPDRGLLLAMSDAPKIEISGLFKSFGPKKVLRGVDLTVGTGESVVVIGGSGSGKSVLLKCILGLMWPESGSIRIDGEESVDLSRSARERVRAKFGMLFQGSALFDSLR